MAHLQIRNIGPLSNVDFPINRLNVIIGKQSTGKSTIAKIMSFCLWLEKDIVAHQNANYIDNIFIKKQLLDYHKLGNYLNDGAFIFYDGESISFEFRGVDNFKITLKDNFYNANTGKVAYIPAERNLVALANISSLSMDKNYVRDFLFNWLSVHDKYKKEGAVPIVDLGVNYYFDTDLNKDRIILKGGKELGIDEVSSGMQSVIPLFIYLRYVTKWVFENDEETSFDKYSVLQKAYIKSLSPDMGDEFMERVLAIPDFNQKLKDFIGELKNLGESEQVSDQLKKMNLSEISQLIDRIGRPHYANVVIEEPELNLFPQTQVRLVYDMLREFDFERDKLLITTHSPYTLYAVNNCMLGFLVKDELDEDDIAHLACLNSVIDPDKVSVWQITDTGTLENIKNSAVGIIGNHYFNEVMNDTLDEYHLMLNYLEL